MRPAYSVILFTTLSGAGYGLLAVLGVALIVGSTPARPILALAAGLVLASAGLVASTFHLGRPERAWRAFSQWRTSWLSREGVAAVAVYGAAFPLGVMLFESSSGPWAQLLAGAMIALAGITVWCTAMIYASLKPIPQWRLPTVPAAYLLLGLASGALILQAIDRVGPWLPCLAMLALAAAWGTKEAYWHAADRTLLPSVAAATGLVDFAQVRPLDPPHTESNYLLHEFGYVVARRHATRLRLLVRLLAFALPLALTLLALTSESARALAPVAALSALIGILAERWLFFAQARHTVMLYYPAMA